MTLFELMSEVCAICLVACTRVCVCFDGDPLNRKRGNHPKMHGYCRVGCSFSCIVYIPCICVLVLFLDPSLLFH